MRANLPDPNYFLGKSIPSRSDITIVTKVDSGNDGHVFRAHSTTLGRDVACKVIPSANLVRDPNGQEIWRSEVLKANALLSPTVVKFEDIRDWTDTIADIDCIVLISEFVEGPSLRKFIRENSDQVTVAFIVEWLATMLNLFNEMNVRGVKHGDLHTGNILVEDRSSYDLLGPRFVFRVTDFGVSEATSDVRFKDDYHQLAHVLAQLLQVVIPKYSSTCSPKEKFSIDVLRHHYLERHLIETDLTRDPLARQPKELLQRLQQIDGEFEQASTQQESLLTPFDFLSCEQIGEASGLLQSLYSDRFLGLAEIEGRNNVVVTGPRGCGKTTVFRSLSLDHRLRVGEADPNGTRYLGVYYRCDDLYFAFPRYIIPERNEALDIPIHFLTTTLLGKLLDSLEVWGREYFPDEFKVAEPRIAEALWKVLGINPPETPGQNSFKSLNARLNKERTKAAERQRFVNDPGRAIGHCVGPEVLQKACEVLSRELSQVRERPIYFFIDDYSAPKITKGLQTSLNRVLMQRSAFCFFKLSTESPVSFAKSDLDEKIYVENREFSLQNLGSVYLHTDVEQKLIFIDDVFRRRLTNTAGYPAKNLEELVGSSSTHNNNELARSIREGKKPQIWSKETLCGLCSGDIHYVISLVGDMVRLCGGPDELAKVAYLPKISRDIQNRAIREAAGNFLKNLRGIPHCGEELVAIVEAFGNVANSHLRFLNSRNQAGNPPKQATRIEPYEPLILSQKAQLLYDELLRYSVFLEDFRGKSRRGKVVPRLFLRRFLIPHFNLTFSTRDSIELEPEEFEAFLLHPKGFEHSMRLKDAQQAQKYEKNTATQTPQQQNIPGLDELT
ncbi:MAG TPA: protein kinase [Pyrinomonadaceae bacterium]|nr:protein kinase [Pyrinomonadaceae bacterium]